MPPQYPGRHPIQSPYTSTTFPVYIQPSHPDKNRIKERERERENYAPKFHVLTSGSLMANPKSGPNYSVFIMK
jgi:hypothetical protein